MSGLTRVEVILSGVNSYNGSGGDTTLIVGIIKNYGRVWLGMPNTHTGHFSQVQLTVGEARRLSLDLAAVAKRLEEDCRLS